MIHSDLSLGVSKDEVKGEQPFHLLEKQRYLGNLVIGPTESGRTILLLKMIQQELFEMKQRELYGNRLNGLTLITPHAAVSDRVALAAENADVGHRVLYFNANNKESIKINPLQGDFHDVVRTFHCMFESVLQLSTIDERNVMYDALTYTIFLTKYNGQIPEGLSVLLKCFESPLYLYDLSEITMEYLDNEKNTESIMENALELKTDLVEWVQKNLGIAENQIVFQYEETFRKLRKVLQELMLYTTTIFTEEQTEVEIEEVIHNGGILIVNTEEYNGDEERAGNMIGTYFLSRLEETLSTRSNTLPIHHIVLDQADKYLYDDFVATFLSNQENHRVSVTLAVETLRLIQNKLGEKAVQQIIEYQYNKLAFGGISVYDARIMEDAIGLKEGQLPYSISKAIMVQNAFHMTTVVGARQEVNQVNIEYIKEFS